MRVPDDTEKQAIIIACEDFIDAVLKPRFLPVIKPTQANYAIDIRGEWRAGRYRFSVRYRSGHAENAGAEFDAPRLRLDRMGPDCFDVYWMRGSTMKWWRIRSGLTLADALRVLQEDGLFHVF